MFDSQQAHANDLAGLEALADRFAVPAYEGKTHQIFTSPDSVKRDYKKRQGEGEAREAARGKRRLRR